MISKSDIRVFSSIIQDFINLERIILFSDFCNLQQLERKERLIEIDEKKRQEYENKKISMNMNEMLNIVK